MSFVAVHYIQVVDFWHQIFTNCRNNGFQQSTQSECTVATVLLQLCILTLLFNRLTAYNICRDCIQCSLTLSVTCSRCEAL